MPNINSWILLIIIALGGIIIIGVYYNDKKKHPAFHDYVNGTFNKNKMVNNKQIIETNQQNIKFCQNCGNPISLGDVYCQKCGSRTQMDI